MAPGAPKNSSALAPVFIPIIPTKARICAEPGTLPKDNLLCTSTLAKALNTPFSKNSATLGLLTSDSIFLNSALVSPSMPVICLRIKSLNQATSSMPGNPNKPPVKNIINNILVKAILPAGPFFKNILIIKLNI